MGRLSSALEERQQRDITVTRFERDITMETIFVIYVLYASAVLIWSSLSPSRVGLRRIIISPALLKEGVVLGADPIIIELRPARPDLRPVSSIPGALVVSSAELGSLVHWTPPGATLVFCEQGEGCHFDRRWSRRCSSWTSVRRVLVGSLRG